MKRIAFIVLLAAMALYPGVSSIRAAGSVYISPTGSDSNPCTLASPCATVTHAIALTPSFIEVLPGTYRQQATIPVSSVGLTIEGSTGFPGDVTFDGAVPVTFTGSAPLWTSSGWFNTFSPTSDSRTQDPSYPFALFVDQVMYDGMPMVLACDPKNGPYPTTLPGPRTVTVTTVAGSQTITSPGAFLSSD